MIDFNRPAFVGKELSYIEDAIHRGMLCGDGEYTKKCSRWMEERFHVGHVMLTTSCTHALEMAAMIRQDLLRKKALRKSREMYKFPAFRRAFLFQKV